MKIIAKLNKRDSEAVELYTHFNGIPDDGAPIWAMAMVHIDHFEADHLELLQNNPEGIEFELVLKDHHDSDKINTYQLD